MQSERTPEKTDRTPSDLEYARQELAQVTDDAAEDGLRPPSELAGANAKRLLEAMYRILPRRFVVYPLSDGRIAIQSRRANGRIMVVNCGPDDKSQCFVAIDGVHRRAKYSTAHELPDGFIRKAPEALA